MKHITIDYHYVCDLVQSSELRVVYVFASEQIANALTKSLSRSHLFYLYNKIDVIYSTPLRGSLLKYFSVSFIIGFMFLLFYHFK